MKGREKLTGRKQLVYVVDFGDGIVKIGRTRRPQGRMSELLKGRNGTPVHMYVTPKMPNACSVEKAALEWLGCDFPRAIGREWFNAPVAEAIAVVNQAALVYGWPDKKTALKYHPAIRAKPPSIKRKVISAELPKRTVDAMSRMCGVRRGPLG